MTDSQSTPDPIELLSALYDDARALLKNALEAAGQPFVVDESRPIVTPHEDGTGWSSSQVEAPVNILRLELLLHPQRTMALWLEQAMVVTREISELLGFTEVPWQVPLMGRPPFFDIDADPLDLTDPTNWLYVHLVLEPAFWYVKEIPSVEMPSMDFAVSIAQEAISVVTSERLTVRQSIALDGIRLEQDPLMTDRVSLRSLSPSERGELLQSYQYRRNSTLQSLAAFPTMSAPGHLLEIDVEVEQPNMIGLLPTPRILLALQLHGVDWSGTGIMSTHLLPEWLTFGRMGRPVFMRPHGSTPTTITQALLDEAVTTSKVLEPFIIEEPEKPPEVALKRFSLGCGRSDFVDALLDFVIALEALLLPRDDETRFADMAYRFRVHGAHFIAELPSERRSIFRSLGNLYETRSRVVHGDRYPDAAQIQNAAQEARRLAARGLLKAVRSQFPDATGFNRLVLGHS